MATAPKSGSKSASNHVSAWAVCYAPLCFAIVALILIIVSSLSVEALNLAPTKKKASPPQLQGGVNPFRESLVSSHSTNAGWRVPKGKIGNIGYRPGQSRWGGDEQKVLAGLSGLVQEKPKISLSTKVEIKHEKIKPIAKYQSLVDALKEADSATKKGRRR